MINCFHILDHLNQPNGIGLYIGASRIDHSCKPTAVASFSGKKLLIRNIEKIAAPVDWTKVIIFENTIIFLIFSINCEFDRLADIHHIH